MIELFMLVGFMCFFATSGSIQNANEGAAAFSFYSLPEAAYSLLGFIYKRILS
jgi:hypothetical protein